MDKMNEINELNEQLNRKMKVITKLLALFFRNFRQTGHYLKKKSNNGMIYILLKTKNKQYMNSNNHINNSNNHINNSNNHINNSNNHINNSNNHINNSNNISQNKLNEDFQNA